MPHRFAGELGKRFAHHPAAIGVDWAHWRMNMYGPLTPAEAWNAFDSPYVGRQFFCFAYPEHAGDDKRADRFWNEIVGVPVESVDTAFIFRFLIAAIDEWEKIHGPIDLSRYMWS